MTDPMTESNLVTHARRELELLGQTAEDPAFSASLVAAVEAFASYGHSGGSAAAGIAMLSALLRFENLSQLTNDPAEWTDVAEYAPGVPLWQSKRNPAAFSDNNLTTAYLLDQAAEGGRKHVELKAVAS